MSAVPRFPVQRAAREIAGGGVVAHPTEGVYGLACDPDNPAAIRRVLTLKRRDPAKGLILLASHLEQLAPWCAPMDDALRERLMAHWPGPVTFILPAARGIDPLLSGGRDTIAARVTAHPLSRALCEALDHPVVSTSANRAGRPPARTARAVRQEFGSGVDFVLAGALGGRDAPTEIRDARDGRVLRGA